MYVNIYSHSLAYGEPLDIVFTIFLKRYCFEYNSGLLFSDLTEKRRETKTQ